MQVGIPHSVGVYIMSRSHGLYGITIARTNECNEINLLKGVLLRIDSGWGAI